MVSMIPQFICPFLIPGWPVLRLDAAMGGKRKAWQVRLEGCLDDEEDGEAGKVKRFLGPQKME